MKIIKSITVLFITNLFISDSPNPKFAVYSGAPVVQDGSGSRGSSWGDIDGDGDEDLFVANRGGQNNLLYINKTTDPSRPVLEQVIKTNVVSDGGDSQGSAFADYDNDGDLDLYVANRRNQKNFLYKNNGDGTFERIEKGTIVNDTLSSTSVSWVDINKDGFSDLFVASRNNQPNALYVNDKKGGFKKLLEGEIVNDLEDTRACAWGDFDNDGDQDLYTGNADMPNSIYINQGDLKFKKLTSGIQLDKDYTYGVSAQDINNDGFVDLFTVNLYQPNMLHLNNGNGTFSKINQGAIVEDEGHSKGIVWQDFDCDGDLDLLISNGTPGSLEDHFYYRNEGDAKFIKIKDAIITKHGGLAGGVTSSDVNNDGRMDLFVTNWVDNSNNKLFFNVTDNESKNWIKVKLKGRKSASTPYGSKVSIYYNVGDQPKAFHQFFNSQSGYASQSSQELYFGLGSTEQIDSVWITWPSGTKQKILKPTLNKRHTILEET